MRVGGSPVIRRKREMLGYRGMATAARNRPMATTKRSSRVEKRRESSSFLFRARVERIFRILTPSLVPTVVTERFVRGQLDARMGSDQCGRDCPRGLQGQLRRFFSEFVTRVACFVVQEGHKSMF